MAMEYAAAPVPQAGIQIRAGLSAVARSSNSSTTHALSAANTSGVRKNAPQHIGRTLCDAVGTATSLILRTTTGSRAPAEGIMGPGGLRVTHAVRWRQRRQAYRGAASEIHHSALGNSRDSSGAALRQNGAVLLPAQPVKPGSAKLL